MHVGAPTLPNHESCMWGPYPTLPMSHVCGGPYPILPISHACGGPYPTLSMSHVCGGPYPTLPMSHACGGPYPTSAAAAIAPGGGGLTATMVQGLQYRICGEQGDREMAGLG